MFGSLERWTQRDRSLGRVGGVAAILLGASYPLVGLTYMFQPDGLNQTVDYARHLRAYGTGATWLHVAEFAGLALGAVLAFAAIPAVAERFRQGAEGWVRWSSAVAYLGFGALAVSTVRHLVIEPELAQAFRLAGPDGRPAVVAAASTLSADPDGWLQFGGVGLWVLAISVIGLRGRQMPAALGIVGIAMAAMYWVPIVATYLPVPSLNAVAAGLGGVVLAPLWYVWLGVLLYRGR